MSLVDKFNDVQKKGIIKAFKLGKQANETGKKASRFEREGKDKDTVRTLRQEAERLRAQQRQVQEFNNTMGLGEKILRGYFVYKLASLACRTLVGLCGGYGYNHGGYAIGHAISDGVDKISDKAADKIVENMGEERAQQIEQTLEAFRHISDKAEELGITKPDDPLLTPESEKDIQELADISRDKDNPNQATEYALKCQGLGLDYHEAMVAFNADRDYALDHNLTPDREKESGLEQERDYGIEI